VTDLTQLVRDWLDIVATGPAEAWPERAAGDVVIRLPFAPPDVPNALHGEAAAIAQLSPVWRSQTRFDWREVAILRTEDPELLVTTARSEVLLLSGQNYANSYVILTRIRDGKVVEHTEYFNPLPVIEAFGLGEAQD
jgi:ketosteroid isomerase-like protein